MLFFITVAGTGVGIVLVVLMGVCMYGCTSKMLYTHSNDYCAEIIKQPVFTNNELYIMLNGTVLTVLTLFLSQESRGQWGEDAFKYILTTYMSLYS